MPVTQGRSKQPLRRNFQLFGPWNERMASLLEEFLYSIASSFPPIRYGQYTGNGEVNQVFFAPSDALPLIVWIVNTTTGVIVQVMVPLTAGPITSWNKESFILDSTASVNTNGTTYQFVALLQPSE